MKKKIAFIIFPLLAILLINTGHNYQKNIKIITANCFGISLLSCNDFCNKHPLQNSRERLATKDNNTIQMQIEIASLRTASFDISDK